jgi:Ca2+-binding RTX toxin-like protein
VNGAQPGIIMEAHPHVGDVYMQENAPGVSQDTAQVLSLNASETAPYGSFNHLLKTAETTPLEPGALDHKVYATGVGQLSEKDEVAGDFDQLVKIRVDGTGRAEKLFGYAGGDEVNGNAGNDSLDGRAGSDTMHGGLGKDLLDGGNDKAADVLYGDAGNDTIEVRTNDHAFGGGGNDTLQLFDNTGFGAIDGGSQVSRNVGLSGGDVLQFHGHLDLTAPGVAGRIAGIETLAMTSPQGGDQLKLNAHDVLDLGDGTFDPNHVGSLGPGQAVRVDGQSGDQLTLTGGNWSHVEAHNAPAGYEVFGTHTSTGNAYVVVQEDVTVHVA